MNQSTSSGHNALFMQTLAGKAGPKHPLWMMRQAGRYLPEYKETRKQAGSFLDLCFDVDKSVEVTIQPIRRFGFDAAILFSDILTVPFGLGQDVRFVEGRGPVLDALSMGDILPLFDPQLFDQKVSSVYQTVAGIRENLKPEDTSLIGFAGAPWTVATYMVEGGSSKDYAKTKAWAYADPNSFGNLIDTLVTATTYYLQSQANAGAQVLKLFDTWAGALSTSQRHKWSFLPIQRIVNNLKHSHPEIPFIVFARGIGQALVAYDGMSAGLALDTSINVSWAKANLNKSSTLQGNLDPIALIAGGAALDREIDTILEAFEGQAHIVNLGHGILPHTPIAHVEQFVKRVKG